jgi:hypothetical protein
MMFISKLVVAIYIIKLSLQVVFPTSGIYEYSGQTVALKGVEVRNILEFDKNKKGLMRIDTINAQTGQSITPEFSQFHELKLIEIGFEIVKRGTNLKHVPTLVFAFKDIFEDSSPIVINDDSQTSFKEIFSYLFKNFDILSDKLLFIIGKPLFFPNFNATVEKNQKELEE